MAAVARTVPELLAALAKLGVQVRLPSSLQPELAGATASLPAELLAEVRERRDEIVSWLIVDRFPCPFCTEGCRHYKKET